MLVLHAHTYLERVVAEIGFVLLLLNRAEAGEDSIQVCVQRAVGNTLPKVVWIRSVVWIGQGQGIDGAVIALIPTYRACVLEHPDDRRGELPLHSKAVICRPRGCILVLQIKQTGGKGL